MSDTPITDAALREAIIEECAKTAEDYNWVDNDNIQGPDEHQAALAAAIRALKARHTLEPFTVEYLGPVPGKGDKGD